MISVLSIWGIIDSSKASFIYPVLYHSFYEELPLHFPIKTSRQATSTGTRERQNEASWLVGGSTPIPPQLVQLPPSTPRRRYLATMPYNIEVLATYRGRLASLDILPASGNA